MKPLTFCLTLVISSQALAQSDGQSSSVDQNPVASVRYSEITRKVTEFDNQTVTVIKVQRPTLPKAPAPLPPPELTAEQQVVIDRRATKLVDTVTVTGIVYLGKRTVTELTWTTGEKKYRAFSNVDFRVFTQMMDVETEEAVYSWFPFISAAEGEPESSGHDVSLRQLADSGDKADYVFEGGTADSVANATTLDALDYLHAYFEIDRTKLMADMEKRVRDEEERLKKLDETPPVKQEITIQYWPVKK